MTRQMNTNTDTESYTRYPYCIYPVTKTAMQRHHLLEQEQLDPTKHRRQPSSEKQAVYCPTVYLNINHQATSFEVSFATVIIENPMGWKYL